MRLVLVLGVIGHLLRLFAYAFLAPLALAAYDGLRAGRSLESALPFAIAFVLTFGAGRALGAWFSRTPSLRRSEALGVVAGSWLLVGHFGAVPYLLAGIAPVDALFESLSGFTTTGATILQTSDFLSSGVSPHDRAFFLWRAMTQWFGGLGVIALFIVVLPRLGIAGRQIFFAEASTAAGDAISPQVRESARRLWVLYTALTAAEAVCLVVAGLPLYDAVVHSMTTLSAGGFSPHHESIRGYANPGAEWVIIVFMVISGTSFLLQYRAFTGRPRDLLRDGEFRTYAAILLLAGLAAGAMLAHDTATGFGAALRAGTFQVASLMSSTGYASADFAQWTPWLKAVLVFVMVVGGCAGSACGGPKVVRYVLGVKYLHREVAQVLHPRAVLPLRHRGSAIPPEVLRSVVSLIVLYLTGYVLVGLVLVVMEPSLTLEDGFSASLACFGNIGPAFGAAGPMGSYAHFSDPAKILLALTMWVGRLEVVTVIALLHPDVWRNLQWRGGAGRQPPPGR